MAWLISSSVDAPYPGSRLLVMPSCGGQEGYGNGEHQQLSGITK